MDALTAVGLGLDYGVTRLQPTPQAWVTVGAQLADQVASLLGPSVLGVEQIGSAAVIGLCAKPIVDLAAGLPIEPDLDHLKLKLDEAGWLYRGDAGADGGHVFVLEARPWHRVAHLHAVEHGGSQWHNYLLLRERLRADPEARRRYESEKLRLADTCAADHRAYTAGKSQIIAALLGEPD